jgi:hypothetical protein
LRQYLDRYAVDFSVLTRLEWVRFAESNTNLFRRVASAGGCRIYAVLEASPSLEMNRCADVSAKPGQIDVSNVKSRELVLKLHYAEWLKATDGVILRPHAVPSDPVPFISASVPAGVQRFSIVRRGAAPR